MYVRMLTFAALVILDSYSEGAGNEANITTIPPTEINEIDEPVDMKYVEEKIANLTRTLKFRPFRVTVDYNRLQVPNFSYLYTRIQQSPDGHNETAATIAEASGFLAQRVKTTLKIKYITDIGDMEEEITFAADMILNWDDPMIYHATLNEFRFPWPEREVLHLINTDNLYKTLDPDIMGTIWKPDIFIENTVKISYPELMSKPVTIRLNELMGQVIFVARVRVKMSCEMDFHYYPADTQICQVILRSNSYSREELKMKWVEPFSVVLEHCEGSGFEYQVAQIDAFEESEGYLNNLTRQFSGLRFSILARRKLSYHIVQTFLPSVFFIVITWLCFFIPSSMGEARIGVAMTTLLTLTAMFASVRENSPIVTYVRAVDIWMLSCVFFVFLTLLEFITALWANHKIAKLEAAAERKDRNAVLLKIQDDEDEPLESNVENRATENIMLKQKNCCTCNFLDCIEKYAVVLYPFIFIIFFVLYWGWLITRSGYLAWNVDRNFNCPSDNEKSH